MGFDKKFYSNAESVVYSHDSTEGFAALWVSYLALNRKADYHLRGYSDLFNDSRMMDTYIFGLTFPEKALDQKWESLKGSKIFAVTDCVPHLSSKEYGVLGKGSKARMAWNYFSACGLLEGRPPWILPYVDEWALGQYRLEGSRELRALFECMDKSFSSWTSAYKVGAKACINQGARDLETVEVVVKRLMENKCMVEFAGKIVPACNAPVFEAIVAEELITRSAPFSVTWKDISESSRLYKFWGGGRDTVTALGGRGNEILIPKSEGNPNHIEIACGKIKQIFVRPDIHWQVKRDAAIAAIDGFFEEMGNISYGLKWSDSYRMLPMASPETISIVGKTFGEQCTLGDLRDARNLESSFSKARARKGMIRRAAQEVASSIGLLEEIKI